MSTKCQLTGRKRSRGRTYAIRGIAKKKKGIGLKVTGKTKRDFIPNTRQKRFWLPEEKRFIRLNVSSSAMRTINKHGISAIVRKMKAQGTLAK